MTSSDSALPVSVRSIVVLGSTATALAVVREGARLGKSVYVADTHIGIAMKSRYPIKVSIPGDDDESILLHLQSLGGSEVALVAASDRWLRLILSHYSRLKRIFGDILHPEPGSLALCLNKSAFLKWCHDFDIPAPKLYEVSANFIVDTAIEYPVIVRPQETLHGVESVLPKAVEVYNELQLSEVLSLFSKNGVQPVVCESAISQGVRQYSIGLARRGSQAVACVAEKIRPIAERCRGGSYVVSRDNSVVQKIAEDVLTKLNFYGIAEVEILWNAETNRYWVIEVNARPWMQFSMANNLLAFAIGESVARSVIVDKKMRWLWFSADVYECFSRSSGLVSTGRLSIRDYALTILSSNVFAFWKFSDPRPFFTEFCALLLVACKQVLRK